ncbi:MAG: hypothetical protein ACT4QA_01445 [Panacagrimonas sp.]
MLLVSAGLALPAAPVRATTPTDYAMPYLTRNPPGTRSSGESITLVSAADFASSALVASVGLGARLIAPTTHASGVVAQGVVTDYRPDSMVYGQDGRWMKVNLRQGVIATPVQVSSEAEAGDACDPSLAASVNEVSRFISTHLGRPAAAAFLYRLQGADGQCGTADDLLRRILLSDGAGTVPATLDYGSLDLIPVYRADGRLLASYVLDSGTLLRVAPDFLSTSVVANGVADFEHVGQTVEGALIAIIDGQLRQIRVSGALVPRPLKRPGRGYEIETALLQEAQVYVTEKALDSNTRIQSRISRVPADGSGPAVEMLRLRERAVAVVDLTDTRLLYLTLQLEVFPVFHSGSTLLSFPLDGVHGSARPSRVHRAIDGLISVVDTRGSQVFFNVLTTPNYPVLGETNLALVKSDTGVGIANHRNGSSWLGGGLSRYTTYDFDNDLDRLLLATRGLGGTLRGVRLSGVDPASLTSVNLARLPVDAAARFPTIGFGSADLGGIETGFGGGERDRMTTDVFAFDLETPRFLRLTQTPGESETAF